MAIHSSILAWVSPWTEEPGGLYSPCSYKESLVIYLFIFLNEHYLMYFSLLLVREGAMCVCSVVSYSLTLWTVAHQAVCPWDFRGKVLEWGAIYDAKAETPVLWPPHAKRWLIGEDSDAGRDWGQEEKGTTGWDGWMASLTRWTWVWVNSGRWWWTGRPGVLRFMGSQRVGHDWVTELNWTVIYIHPTTIII